MTYHLYFAYGSNLDEQQMIERCPSAVLIATGSLVGYRLAFAGWSSKWQGGVANVERCKADRVRGLIWEISTDDLLVLDRFEGRPHQYDRKPLQVTDRHGRKRMCWVYYMVGRKPRCRPSMDYFAQIAASYASFRFAQTRLTKAMLSAPLRQVRKNPKTLTLVG